ncbi:MAG: ETC complex I subunit [Pseudomonadota bacterium]
MVARIYRPAKTAMQSGKGKSQYWVLEHEPQAAKKVEPLMGYTSSSDMMAQVKLKFETREDAIGYAQRNDIPFRVVEPKDQSRRAVSYSDNFKFDRKVPWTH